MIPIRDHNPSTRRPYVTWALIVLNVAIFVSYAHLFQDNRALAYYFRDWALIPGFVVHGEHLHGLLTSMFLHGGWLHLAGNMLFLWIFGDNLEDELGHMGFLGFYLVSGIVAGLAQLTAAPTSLVPIVGASGAIAGVMGGYLLLFPKARIDIFFFFIVFFKIIPVPAWVMLGFWFGAQLFNSAVSDAGAGGVAYLAHAGGFIIGFMLMFPVWKRRGGMAYWNQTHGHPPHPEAQYRTVRSSIPTVRKRK